MSTREFDVEAAREAAERVDLLDAAPDPKHGWKRAGRDSAVSVFLDTVEQAVNRSLDAAPSPAPTDTKEGTSG